MENVNFDKFIDESKKILANVKETISSYAAVGKQKIDLFGLEAEQGKAQKQLGALVYSLYKTGQQDTDLTQQYIDTLDDIATKIEQCRTQSPIEVSQSCNSCGAGIGKNDVFCSKCGQKQAF